mgnify:CR=1 FL=1
MRARILGALALAGCGVVAPALDPSVSVSQYHKQYWQVEQGLPHSYVYSIETAPDGFLLVATAEGLARFDGLNFGVYRPGDSVRLSQRWISSVFTARNGSLWVGTFDGALFEIADANIRSRHNLGGSIFHLVQDAEGVLWAGTRKGVFRLNGQTFIRQEELGPPLEMSWNILHPDATGTMWVVTADGLYRKLKDRFICRIPNNGRYGEILTAKNTRSGALWIGTNKGLFRFSGAETGPPVVEGPVVALLEDQNGVLWAGTWGRGLFRVHLGRVDRWSSAQGLPDDFIRTLYEDCEGNLWIGMRSGGIGCWREPRILNYGLPEGLSGDYASVVAADRRGDLWLGTWRGGLYKLVDGVLHPQPLPMPTLYFSVSALAVDSRANLWLGNWEGLFESANGRFRYYGTRPDSPLRRITAILFDRGGALWLGTDDRGLFRFPEGRPTEPVPAASLARLGITALLEASNGTVWVGTTEGLYQFVRPEEPPVAVAELPSGRVYSITEDSKSRIWASSFGMLWMVAPGHRCVFDRRHGLPEQPYYRVVEDQRGQLWVSSPRGLFEIRAESVEQVLSGQRQNLVYESYAQEDGLRSAVFHGLSQPAGARAPDGSLWFPTVRGFVRVRPESPRSLPPPKTVIEEISVNGRPSVAGAKFDIDAGARNITIRYTALRLSSPRKVLFRFRLAGVDRDWVETGHERTARYNELPPGIHEFQVQARDPWGDWGEAATMTLIQHPRFFQTWWFYLLLGFTGIFATVSLYRWRLLSVRSRYAAILEERNRIGREWHDTLVAGFSAISLQLEAALAALGSKSQRAAEILEVTRRMVHHYRAEARRVIWDLRDSRPEDESLPSAVEDALRRVTEPRGIRGTVSVEGHAKKLPVEIQHNLLRICQEAISNAARHANPRTIEVKLIFAPDKVRAIVIDDGRGFPESPQMFDSDGHFGLTVMQERARRHGGCLQIASSPGHGTTVEATMPLDHRR